jgi:hypothetical protein
VVIDLLLGRGRHCYDLYFHLMPDADLHLDARTGTLYVGSATQPGLIIAPLAESDCQTDLIVGATAPIQGWVSFFSGQKQPAPTLRCRLTGEAPTRFCTVLYPHAVGQNATIAVEPLDIALAGQPAHIADRFSAIRVETDRHIDYLAIDRGPAGAVKRFAGYETDASLVYVRHAKADGHRERVICHGGSQLLYQGQPAKRIKQICAC